MFDITEAYNGSMVPAEGAIPGQENFAATTENQPKTADEILQHAREEAADILEKAQAQADELLAEKKVEAEQEATRLVAEKINKTFTELGPELYSAKAGIAEIVGQSIHLMLGAIGTEKAFALAVNKATHDYMKSSSLKVHAHPDSANRLKLYNISNPNKNNSAKYEIIDDMSLEPGRCILDTGEKRIEVSLEVQIQALKSSIENTISGGKA